MPENHRNMIQKGGGALEAVKELALVRRMKKGDRAAFDELYEQYYDRLYRTACMITGNRTDVYVGWI